MRIRVSTVAGSLYVLDSKSMTWERINKTPGHEDIPGFPEKNGKLAMFPHAVVGYPLQLLVEDPNDSYIHHALRTSTIVRAELI